MDEVRIRTASVSDMYDMYDMEKACFSDPWDLVSIGAELMFEDTCYLIAEKEGAPVGFAGLRYISGEVHIMNICVLPKYRRRGIGEKLLLALISRGEGKNSEGYTLEVRAGNAPAISLYEKHGFVSSGIRKGYYSNGEDAVIMWKKDPEDVVQI